MAAVEITISGVLYDKLARTTRPVVLIGEASLTGLGVGGGPMPPGEGSPPGIWGGPIDPHPDHGLPGKPPSIWPSPGHPAHPIELPPEPSQPPTGEPDDDGFIKPPPASGGWSYHNEYGWGYYPAGAAPGPKKG